MKITHELNQLEFGGVERMIHNIIKFDKENEYVIAGYKDGPFRKELESVGARVVILSDDVVDIAADVIHIHSGGANSKLARDLKGEFPVIETIHSPVRSANTSNLVNVRVGVSEAVSRMNDPCRTIKNGLDFEAMEPTLTSQQIIAELRVPIGHTVVGRLGRIGKDKGLEDYLLTCYELQQQGYVFTPLIVGGESKADEGYIGKLKLMADSLPVKGVIFAGHKDDVANYLQVMDVFLYPSPTEGFGLVFCEAMYAGCMVVSYDTDVTREIIGGYSFLTKESEGYIGLVEGVKKVWDKEVAYEIMGDQIGFVKAEYQAERMSKDYQDLYKEVANK